MTIKTGDRIPDATLKVVTGDGVADMTTSELFGGKKTVVFGVPGAFTPTCSLNHLPGFVENHDTILAKGVDAIVCISVNDHFVMKAWADSARALDKIAFVADGDASFTKALGLDATLGVLGLRSRRYSMIVDDGVVTSLNIETEAGVNVSGAAALLEMLG